MANTTFEPYSGTNTEWCKRCTRPKSEHVNGMCPVSDPLKQRSHDLWIVLAALCGIFAVIALFVFLLGSNTVSQCNSGLGQLAQGLDGNSANSCSTAEAIHAIAGTALIVCGLGCVGSIWKASKK